MTQTLVIVRHGPSAHVRTGGAVNRAGVEQWRRAYDTAGLLATAHPPVALAAIADAAACVISSDMARAVESASRLAPGREIRTTSLLREMPLDVPAWPTRLPLSVWGSLIYVNWQVRVACGADAYVAERSRASAAIAFITTLVPHAGTGVVVTHGAFRTLLAAQLVRSGWRCTARRDGYGYWSAWSFEARPPRGVVSRPEGRQGDGVIREAGE